MKSLSRASSKTVSAHLSRYVKVLTESERAEILRLHNEGEPFTFAIFRVAIPAWARQSAQDVAIEDDIHSPNCRVSFVAITSNL